MEKEKDVYDFYMEHRGAKCSCSCPCNSQNPVDVSVTFQAEKTKQTATLSKENIKKLS